MRKWLTVIIQNSLELPVNGHSFKIWFIFEAVMLLYDVFLYFFTDAIVKSRISAWLIIDGTYLVTIALYNVILRKLPRYTHAIGLISFVQISFYLSDPMTSVSQEPAFLLNNMLETGCITAIMMYDCIPTIVEGLALEVLYFSYCIYNIKTREELQSLSSVWTSAIKYVIYSFLVSSVSCITAMSSRYSTMLNKLRNQKTTSSWVRVMNNIFTSIKIESNSQILYTNDTEGKLEKVNPILNSTNQKKVYYNDRICNIVIVNDLASMREEQSKKFCQMLVATITHELRAPLTIIMHILKEIQEMSGISELHQSINHGLIATSLQECLINDILDVAKINNGNLVINSDATDVHKTSECIFQLFKIKIEKGIKYSLNIDNSVPPLLAMDEKRYRQILINLITNAIKFTKEGYITIDIHYSKKYLYCSVSDSGVGIADSDKSKLFIPFGMLESTRGMNKAGTGLGLNLCKNLLQAMNGDITFTSEKGVSTVFTFWIPCELFVGRQEILLIPRSRSLHERNVLNIDDDYLSLCILDSFAIKYGVGHRSFTHAHDAIIAMQKDSAIFTMGFVDINMPELSGYDVARILKSINNKIMLVALTGEDKQSILNACTMAGFDEVVEKPISYEAYCKCIEKYHS